MKIRRMLRLLRIVTLLTVLMMIATQAMSQRDTTVRYQNVDGDSAVSYLTPMQYAFMLHEENNWLFKANLLVTSANRGSTNLKLSLEKKLSKEFSLNAVLLNYQSYNVFANQVNLYNYGLQFLLEPRWYYRQRIRDDNVKSYVNLSGAYLSLSAGYQTFSNMDGDSELHPEQDYVPVYLKWGLQRRFLKHGYVDIGLSTGYRFSLNDAIPSSFSVRTFTEAGLVFARDRHKLDFNKLCPVLRCQAADKRIFKINLMDAASFSYFRNTYSAFIAPNIGAEFKIGASPFSVNTMLSFKTQVAFSNRYDYDLVWFYPEFLLEGRWYYNLNRRILNGKSGNGLSANYVSLGAIYNGRYMKTHRDGNTYHSDQSLFGVMVSSGIQRLINKHLYYDLNVGLGYGREFQYESNTNQSTWDNKFVFNLGIAIGWRF